MPSGEPHTVGKRASSHLLDRWRGSKREALLAVATPSVVPHVTHARGNGLVAHAKLDGEG